MIDMGFFEKYFDKFIEEPMSGCWLWIGSQTSAGYGNIRLGNKNEYAHRLAYSDHTNKSIPRGKVIRHRCDNPCCVNPDHLLIGTHKDNNNDAWRRNRMRPVNGEQSGRSVLTEKQVIQSRKMARSGKSISEISSTMGKKRSTLESAIIGLSWKHVSGPVPLHLITKKLSCPPHNKGGNAPSAKITEKEARAILVLAKKGTPYDLISSIYGISKSSISEIKTGKTWRHIHGN